MLLHAPGTPWKASKRPQNASEILLFPTRGGGRGGQHGSAKIKKRSQISEISDFENFNIFWIFLVSDGHVPLVSATGFFCGSLNYVVYTKNKHVRHVSIGFSMDYRPELRQHRLENRKKILVLELQRADPACPCYKILANEVENLLC